MSIAEKLQKIAENEQKVFDAGKKAEYDAFWDPFQNYGQPVDNLAYRFYRWEDACYNPKYPFTVKGLITVNQMFYRSSITDTKVDIDLSGSTASDNTLSLFHNAQKLKTVRKVIVNEIIRYENWFTGCSALEEIRFEGTIANNIDFKVSKKLTLLSLINILNHLKDFTGTDEEYTRTLTLSKESVAVLNADSESWLTTLLGEQKKWKLISA